jgi:DNA-binding winged helix-turn-helix (wHTH) protein/predicted ATPase
MSSPDQLAFGPFRLDPTHMRLWRGDEPIALQRQPLAVLQYLVANPGRVVPAAELLRHAWGGAHVSRTTLKVCVRAIRVALGDDAGDPRYLETVGREGYRFLVLGSLVQRDGNAGDRPVVGRGAVLDRLERCAAAAQGGERQLVFVTGEPGIGKSTVVDQFARRIGVTRLMSTARGQCLEQYGEGEAYLPMLEALVQLARAPGGGALVDVLRRCAPTWLVQMPGLVPEPDRAFLEQRAAGASRERMLREMAEALDVLTAEQALVLILEDLHWSDRSTVELLAYLAQRRERAKLLLVGTYRPVELVVSEHPLLDVAYRLQSHGHCLELPLELLAEQDVTEYVALTLGHADGSVALAREIHRRTDGNPFFMVNLIEDHLARGGDATRAAPDDAVSADASVPTSIQMTIQRQIARRSPEARSILEAASVAGMEFVATAVASALELEPERVDTVCEQLAHEGHFLRPAGIAEWRDGTISGKFAFRHALYQQVLYLGVSDARRVRLHRRIGEREELGHGERAGDVAARLAVHFSLGRDLERAVHYLARAGENALRRSAYHEAVRQFADALELLPRTPSAGANAEREFVLQARLAAALMVTQGAEDPAVVTAAARALELSRRVPDDPGLIPVIDGVRGIFITRGELRSARDLAERGLSIAQRGTDPMRLGSALYGAGSIALFCGDFAVARERLEQIVAFADAAPPATAEMAALQDPLLVAQALFAGVLWFTGFPDEASRRSRETLARACQVAQPLTLANVHLFTTMVHLGRDEIDEVRERAQSSRMLGEQHGFTTLIPSGRILEGWALAHQNQVARGVKQMRQAFTEYEATSGALFKPWFLALLAQAVRLAGRTDEVLELLHRALAVGEQTGERTCEAELYRMKGELLLASPQPRAKALAKPRGARPRATRAAAGNAEECFVTAIEIARRQGAKSWELRAVTSLSRLLHAQGRSAEARDELGRAYGWFSEGFATPDLQAARQLLAELG